MALHPYCYACEDAQISKIKKHPEFNALDRFWSYRLSGIRQGADDRNIFVGVSIYDLIQKWIDQDGRCALTGIKLDYNKRRATGRGGSEFLVPSVDRIDSHGNYTLDNIQIVSAVVNVMKNDLTQTQFLKFCRLVANHEDRQARAVESELLAAI